MNDVNQWAKRHREKRAEKKTKKRVKLSPSVPASHARPIAEPKRFLGNLDLTDDLVTVSVATWRTPPAMVEKAVASILDGSHAHVRVVAISDGAPMQWSSLSRRITTDPRFIYLDSPKNMGPYFNHDVVLRSALGPWFAVQDADDWSHKHRFRDLLSSLHAHRAEAVHADILQIEVDGQQKVLHGSAQTTENWAHRANHFGVYSVSALQALGGYHAGFRVGYDTNLTSFLNLLAVTRMARGVLYVRKKRAESLTRAAATGHGSPLRKAHKVDLRRMWQEVVALSRTSKAGAVKHAREVAVVRCRRHGDNRVRDELVAVVKSTMAERTIDLPPLHPAHLRRVLHGASTGSPWAVTLDLAQDLFRRCESLRPKVIVDVGSGLSTAVFALYAARYGATVISLEHDQHWKSEIVSRLKKMGLESHVQLLHGALRSARGGVWYAVDLERALGRQKIDLVFVDGPPQDLGGRGAVTGQLTPLLADRATVLLHDACRPEERAPIAAWRAAGADLTSIETAHDKRGMGVLEFRR